MRSLRLWFISERNRFVHRKDLSGLKETFSDISKISLNGKTRIFTFFGTRPEIIKMVPVIQTFVTSNHLEVITVFTGQHPDHINPFLEIFDIKVDI